jgi:hypothetical protein
MVAVTLVAAAAAAAAEVASEENGIVTPVSPTLGRRVCYYVAPGQSWGNVKNQTKRPIALLGVVQQDNILRWKGGLLFKGARTEQLESVAAVRYLLEQHEDFGDPDDPDNGVFPSHRRGGAAAEGTSKPVGKAKGAKSGQLDTYFIGPNGVVCRSRPAMFSYINAQRQAELHKKDQMLDI